MSHLLALPLSVTTQPFLLLMAVAVLRGAGQVLCTVHLNFGLSGVFSHDEIGVAGSEVRHCTSVITSSKGRVIPAWLLPGGVNLSYLVKVLVHWFSPLSS